MPDDARFCPSCGTAVDVPCRACGAPMAPTDRFCRACGTAQRPEETRNTGEHKQLTVVFCDVVGSTRLSIEADAEDLRDALQRYQQICAEAVERNDGMIAQYLGDGIVAYFGYPVSNEDAPALAAEAALAVVGNLAAEREAFERAFGTSLQVRVGIHTGRVLVTEMGAGRTRAPNSVTGAVPNIAARIEACAPENGIAVSQEFRDRLRGRFAFDTLGVQELKGVDAPIEVFQLLGRAKTGVILETAHAGAMVGREDELGQLLEVWRGLPDRNGPSFATVTGEPGIGKSGLIAQFLVRGRIQTGAIVALSGTAADRSSPFASLLRFLDAELQLHALPAKAAEARISEWCAANGSNDSRAADALIALRRSSAVGDDPSDDGTDARQGIFGAFRTFLETRPGTTLLLAEDAHWIDASTLAMIDFATEAGARASAMVLTASRPSEGVPWHGRTDVRIELSGLNRSACAEIMQRIAGDAVPEPALVTHVVEIAGGVPLFVEELTRAMQANGAARDVNGRLRLDLAGAETATPSTLLDLLMARLDSLGEAKGLAQIAAVLGRAVSTAALAAIARVSLDDLSQALSQLYAAEVMVQAGQAGIVRFRHALFQKAAYETLVRRRRAEIHGAYVDWLQKSEGPARKVAPEELGYHCFGAGRYAEASNQYRQAGLRASLTSANREAAQHFSRSLEALDQLPDSDAVQRLELRIRYAGAVLGAEGPGAPATTAAYEEAVALCDATPFSRWHFPAYWGWWRISKNFPEMSARAARIVDVADSTKDDEFRLQAHHCMWANSFQIGAFAETLEHARVGLDLYHPERSAEQGILYGGHDPRVCAHGQIALTRWLRGSGDSCRPDIAHAIGHAEELGHLGSLLHGLDIAVTLHCHRRDIEATLGVAERLIVLGKENEIDEYLAKGRFFRGWARVQRGEAGDGLGEMNEAYAIMQSAATNEDFPLFQCLRAETLRAEGDLDGAVAALGEAREIIATEGVTYWAAEIERQDAEIEMARERPDADRIAVLLNGAAAAANEQGALALSLRAAVSRARWSRHTGEIQTALHELSRVRGLFDRAAGGMDLADADLLANTLRRRRRR